MQAYTSEQLSQTALTVEFSGLTSKEVEAQKAKGLSNDNFDVKTKSVVQILKEHALTLFNAVNLCMAALVWFTGQYRNMLFVAVVIANLVIGVFQEIRAKRIVDRLAILTATHVKAIRNGAEIRIPVSEVVLNDIIVLSHGDQVPADADVLSGFASMNESLLTGEAKPVEKQAGSSVLSGSFVDSGSLICRVSAVGAQSYAAKINAAAKYVKPVHSEIKDSITLIVRFGTAVLIPLGILLFLRTLLHDGMDLNQSILSTVSAVVAMIPQGLVLLTSTVLAIATTRLARSQVLIQQTYCVENLARVDEVCLDKTGTITTGYMQVKELRPYEVPPSDKASFAPDAPDLKNVLACVCFANKEDANETAQAILRYLKTQGITSAPKEIVKSVPFSSKRKYSGCICKDGSCLLMGAAQFVLGADYDRLKDTFPTFAELDRVLVIAQAEGFQDDGSLIGIPQVLGFIALEDEIRKTAASTIQFFIDQGVSIRVISGDDPQTVSAIAKRVGVPHADNYIDASVLTTEDKLKEAVDRCAIFGRVTPELKRKLVEQLQASGHSVAMTGDGVNDILALKAADCSVAMVSGSAAARNVAEIVLADNDFAHLPEVVAQGRRSINNLQRSAALFLVKTVYAALLSAICIFLPPYPFIPVQASLLSFVIIGLPSFVLALEANHERVTGSFFEHVFSRSLPASFAIVLSLLLAIAVLRFSQVSFEVLSTICMYIVFIVGFVMVWRISFPLNRVRIALLTLMAVLMLCSCIFLPRFFLVADLSIFWYLFCLVLGTGASFIFLRLYDLFVHNKKGVHLVEQLLKHLRSFQHKKRRADA